MPQAAEGFSERWRWPTWTVSMVALPPARGSIVHRFDSQELVESLIQINPPRARGVAYGDGLADRLVSLRDTSQRGTPMKLRSFQQTGWTRIFPPLTWLAEYKPSWLRHDAIAGVTLAAYAIPVSLAYAGLARPPRSRS